MIDTLILIVMSCLLSLLIVLKTKKTYKLNKSIFISLILSIAVSIVFILYMKLSMKKIIVGTIVSTYLCTLLFSDNVNIKKLPKTLCVFLLFFCTEIFQVLYGIILRFNIENLSTRESIILVLLGDLTLTIILIYLYRKELKKSIDELKKKFYPIFDTSFKYWFIGIMLMGVSNIFLKLIVSDATAVNEETVQSLINAYPYLLLVTAGVLGPINEELVFRRSFRDIFKNDYVFIFTSGLVFGSLHVILAYEKMIDLLYFLPYSFLGFAFATMVVKTDNDTSSIMMHMMHNTVLTAISILMGMIIL